MPTAPTLHKHPTNIAVKRYADSENTTDSLACYLRDIDQFDFKLLTAEQEQEIGARIQAGDPAATKILIESNLRLVIAIARTYIRENVSLLDLIQEGNRGLMHAVKKWDYRFGTKFSTYATWWIRQYISRSLGPMVNTIDLPDYVALKVKRLKRTQADFYAQHEREATFAELLQLTDFTEEQLTDLFRFMEPTISLDQPQETEKRESVSLGDMLEDSSSLFIDEPIIEIDSDMDRKAQLVPLLKRLTPREKKVIELRYGLAGQPTHKLKEVGTLLKISRERVRQLEAQALAKMRAPAEAPRALNTSLLKLLEQKKAVAR